MIIDEWILLVVAVVEIVNISLLLGLIYIYWGSYKETKSKFSIGLLFFSSVFLLKSVLFLVGVTVFALGVFGDPGGEGPPFGFFLVNILECVALAILLKITWE